MIVNMELYKVFYYVVKAGSISRAAKDLYISQPAVSQSIKQLETELGGRVFFRTSKGIRLTSEGEVLFKYIEQGYDFIMTAENKFLEMRNLVKGQLRVSTSDTLCQYYLLPYLKEFHSRYPDINIKINNQTTPETIKLLKSGKVDIGIVTLPIKNDKNFLIKEVFEIEDCFVCGEKYKFLSDEIIELKKLLEYPILLLQRDSNTRKLFDKYIREHGFNITPDIEIGSSDLLIEFAKIGLGISYVVKDFIKDKLEKEELYEIKTKEKMPKRSIGLVTHKNFPVSAAAKEFMELL
ncbi:LysR family transcriptional regulator [Dethiothermospora halolimnae]|uniref:LysR family transcriptional regulator n=1 Tax=Dethiothermospora halolimnae TaxID=3114390 RepID=UPI003CCBCD8F